MGDVNKVWLSGLVVSKPEYSSLPSETPSTRFFLKVNEKYLNKHGDWQIKPNTLLIESLGKAAKRTFDQVKEGSRFTVDGYLRCDEKAPKNKVRVRTFAVYPDDSNDAISHKEALKYVLDILRRSRDLDSATATIQDLIAST